MKINPFDYLHYKAYRAWSKLDGGRYPGKHHGVSIFLYLMNIWTIYMLTTGRFISEKFAFGSIFLTMIIVYISYLPRREDKIIAKYSQESEESCGIGNVVVILYVIASIVAFVLTMRSLR